METEAEPDREPPPEKPTRHLLEHELAERWRVSLRTVQRWRKSGKVPRHFRMNQRVLYRLRDLEAFEISRLYWGDDE